MSRSRSISPTSCTRRPSPATIFALAGSMNITFNGIQLREELVDLRTDQAYVAQARMDAFDRFGGVL